MASPYPLSTYLKAFAAGIVLAVVAIGVYVQFSEASTQSATLAFSEEAASQEQVSPQEQVPPQEQAAPRGSAPSTMPTDTTTPGPSADLPSMTVYNSPTCGCCSKWVDHLREHGFTVTMKQRQDMGAVKTEQGVPRNLQSCHTGVIDGYVVEGHVPAKEVRKLLKQRPDVAGLTVPGMPIGSPGMERGDQLQPYDVLTFTDRGSTGVFARYR